MLAFFEITVRVMACTVDRIWMTGNPVKIGGGCATVKGYKLSKTTGIVAGKGE
jgi:hypothetical protein